MSFEQVVGKVFKAVCRWKIFFRYCFGWSLVAFKLVRFVYTRLCAVFEHSKAAKHCRSVFSSSKSVRFENFADLFLLRVRPRLGQQSTVKKTHLTISFPFKDIWVEVSMIWRALTLEFLMFLCLQIAWELQKVCFLPEHVRQDIWHSLPLEQNSRVDRWTPIVHQMKKS